MKGIRHRREEDLHAPAGKGAKSAQFLRPQRTAELHQPDGRLIVLGRAVCGGKLTLRQQHTVAQRDRMRRLRPVIGSTAHREAWGRAAGIRRL